MGRREGGRERVREGVCEENERKREIKRRRGHRQKDYERGREVGSVKKLRTIRKIKGMA